MAIFTNMGIFVEEFLDRNCVLVLMGMFEKLKSEFSFVTWTLFWSVWLVAMEGIKYCYLSCKLRKFNFLIAGDVLRVSGQLAVSRAFGDRSLKTHLRSDPYVKELDVDSETQFLILASDGLWKVGILQQFSVLYQELQIFVLLSPYFLWYPGDG